MWEFQLNKVLEKFIVELSETAKNFKNLDDVCQEFGTKHEKCRYDVKRRVSRIFFDADSRQSLHRIIGVHFVFQHPVSIDSKKLIENAACERAGSVKFDTDHRIRHFLSSDESLRLGDPHNKKLVKFMVERAKQSDESFGSTEDFASKYEEWRAKSNCGPIYRADLEQNLKSIAPFVRDSEDVDKYDAILICMWLGIPVNASFILRMKSVGKLDINKSLRLVKFLPHDKTKETLTKNEVQSENALPKSRTSAPVQQVTPIRDGSPPRKMARSSEIKTADGHQSAPPPSKSAELPVAEDTVNDVVEVRSSSNSPFLDSNQVPQETGETKEDSININIKEEAIDADLGETMPERNFSKAQASHISTKEILTRLVENIQAVMDPNVTDVLEKYNRTIDELESEKKVSIDKVLMAMRMMFRLVWKSSYPRSGEVLTSFIVSPMLITCCFLNSKFPKHPELGRLLNMMRSFGKFDGNGELKVTSRAVKAAFELALILINGNGAQIENGPINEFITNEKVETERIFYTIHCILDNLMNPVLNEFLPEVIYMKSRSPPNVAKSDSIDIIEGLEECVCLVNNISSAAFPLENTIETGNVLRLLKGVVFTLNGLDERPSRLLAVQQKIENGISTMRNWRIPNDAAHLLIQVMIINCKASST